MTTRPRKDADSAYRAGLDALDGDDEAAALACLQTAIEDNPGDARLWQVAGLLHRSLDDLGGAVAAFERAITLAPTDPQIAHGLARSRLEAGLPATEEFRAAVTLAPKDDPARLGLSAALLAAGDGGGAIAELDRATQRLPTWLEGQAVLARLRWMMADREHFTKSIERGLMAEPRHFGLWQTLITALIHAERFDLALKAIAVGRRTIGDHPVFALNEPGCLDEMGEHRAAAAIFDRNLAPADAGFAVRHLRNALRRGQAEKAVAIAAPFLETAAAHLIWPYASLAWRMTDDPRAQWLESDPALIASYDLPLTADEIARLAVVVRGLHRGHGQPLDQSARGGTQSEGNLLSRIEPEIVALRAKIVSAVETYRAQLPTRDLAHPLLAPRRDRRIRFSGSWSIRLGAGGRHVQHVHPGGWFSSALYLGVPCPESSGPAPAGWLSLGDPAEELGLTLSPLRRVEPRPGRLVLFPSTMWHGTVPFVDGERLTVAFDVAPPR